MAIMNPTIGDTYYVSGIGMRGETTIHRWVLVAIRNRDELGRDCVIRSASGLRVLYSTDDLYRTAYEAELVAHPHSRLH